ncbi:unnamed protein product [Prorocentrum cordatum]|uniref:Secreted protein n=1 Tax=Prorocentrum cordatum TaxID=2364126 RepID=A0ABN9XX42_9DINO|nr:unnamed protein product [Polarella glacialis]
MVQARLLCLANPWLWRSWSLPLGLGVLRPKCVAWRKSFGIWCRRLLAKLGRLATSSTAPCAPIRFLSLWYWGRATAPAFARGASGYGGGVLTKIYQRGQVGVGSVAPSGSSARARSGLP